MPSHEYLAKAKKFQRMFSPYFQHFADDLREAALEMEWLESRLYIDPPPLK